MVHKTETLLKLINKIELIYLEVMNMEKEWPQYSRFIEKGLHLQYIEIIDNGFEGDENEF